MATRPDEIGNGVGRIYVCGLADTTVIFTDQNTEEGAIRIRDYALGLSAIGAQRPAVATLSVTSGSGAGTITAISVSGINQLGSPIAISSTNVITIAGQIVAGINSYSPSLGYRHTATAVSGVVSIFSPIEAGAAENGILPTITKTGNSAYTLTPFQGGSANTGVTDATLGLRFFVDSAASPDPTTIGANALDCTKYLVSRGLNSGMISTSITIAADGISGINRSSVITTIIVDTQGGAATDVLAFIDPTGFIEGDLLIIHSLSASKVTTIESAPVTTSASAVKNIYLINDNPFVTDAHNGIMLQYRYTTALGGFFNEFSRAMPASVGFNVEISRAALLALMSAGTVVVGTRYQIFDVGDGLGLAEGNNAGIVVIGETATTVSIEGTFLAKIVDRNVVSNFWTVGVVAASGDKYECLNEVYISSANANANAPYTLTNWSLSPKSSANYATEIQSCIYDITNDIIKQRSDARGNVLNNLTTVASANECILQGFQWGLDTVYGNIITYSQPSAGFSAGRLPNSWQYLTLSNCNGGVYKNTITNNRYCYYLQFSSDNVGITNNTITGGSNLIFASDLAIYPIASIGFCTIINSLFTGWLGTLTNSIIRNSVFADSEASNILNSNLVNSDLGGNATTTLDNCNGELYVHGNTTTYWYDITGNPSSQTEGALGVSSLNIIQNNSYFEVKGAVLSGATISSNSYSPTSLYTNDANRSLITISLNMKNGSVFSGNTLETVFTIKNVTLDGTTWQNCKFNNAKNFGGIGGGITKITNCSFVDKLIDGESGYNAFILYPVAGINDNQSTAPTYDYGFSMNGEFSTATFLLNVSAASTFASNTLTIPAGLSHIGTFLLWGTAGQIIYKIANLYPAAATSQNNILRKRFICINGLGVRFSPVIASAVSSVQQFTAQSAGYNPTRYQDQVTFKSINAVLTIVESLKVL